MSSTVLLPLASWLKQSQFYDLLDDAQQRYKKDWSPRIITLRDVFDGPFSLETHPPGALELMYRENEELIAGAEFTPLWNCFVELMQRWTCGSMEYWVAEQLYCDRRFYLHRLPRELMEMLGDILHSKLLSRSEVSTVRSPVPPPFVVPKHILRRLRERRYCS